MVIGIDASRANRDQKTGVEWYSYHLIEKLKKDPQSFGDTFILYSLNKLKGNLAQLPENWQSRQLFWFLKYFWTQIRLAWEILINSPDLLFVPAHALPVFSLVKSVMTIHDLGFKKYPQHYSIWQRIYYSFVHWWGTIRAEQIIVPSVFTQKELTKLYHLSKDKIKVIPLGYDQENYFIRKDRNEMEAILSHYGVKMPYFLYVGRLEKKKNIKGLIQAYQQLTINHQSLIIPSLVLIGQPGYGYSEVKNQIKKNKNIIFLGYVKNQDLAVFYNRAEAFIFPSFYEGFGIPILEAMACGCPVLASRVASIPEVGGQADLYFNPQDISEITQSMNKIIKHQDLKKDLIAKGLEQVKNFSWERCAEKTLKVLLNT